MHRQAVTDPDFDRASPELPDRRTRQDRSGCPAIASVDSMSRDAPHVGANRRVHRIHANQVARTAHADPPCASATTQHTRL